ncbi:MAG: DUF4058 family protein [Cyanobacteria bacterium J06627_32]
MPIPFPGMNPYLEHPDLWPTVHQRLMTALADTLKHQLPSSYQVRLRERRYQVSGEDSLVVGSPGLDWGRSTPAVAASTVTSTARNHSARNHPIGATRVATQPPLNPPIPVLVPVPQKIYETYLEIVDLEGDIVTVIEALSPKKKRPGRGRDLYERQRETIFGSATHLVEIDLLRGWEPPSIYGPDEAGDYRILISRSEQRPRAQLYTWNVMEPIPTIALPLKGPHDMPLALKPVVDQACDRTDLLVNYQQAPLPPLRFEETLWLDDFLQKVGMRPCAS